jgi:hypothetical protein
LAGSGIDTMVLVGQYHILVGILSTKEFGGNSLNKLNRYKVLAGTKTPAP